MSKKHFQERLQDVAKNESLSFQSENNILKKKLFDMEQELIRLKNPKELVSKFPLFDRSF